MSAAASSSSDGPFSSTTAPPDWVPRDGGFVWALIKPTQAGVEATQILAQCRITKDWGENTVTGHRFTVKKVTPHGEPIDAADQGQRVDAANVAPPTTTCSTLHVRGVASGATTASAEPDAPDSAHPAGTSSKPASMAAHRSGPLGRASASSVLALAAAHPCSSATSAMAMVIGNDSDDGCAAASSDFTARDLKRQATDAGFFFQYQCTLRAWFKLEEEGKIAIERHEDYDIIRPACPGDIVLPVPVLTPGPAREKRQGLRGASAAQSVPATADSFSGAPRAKKANSAAAAAATAAAAAGGSAAKTRLECHQVKNSKYLCLSELGNCLGAMAVKLRDWRKTDSPRLQHHSSMQLVLELNSSIAPMPIKLTQALLTWQQFGDEAELSRDYMVATRVPRPVNKSDVAAAAAAVADPQRERLESVARDLHRQLKVHTSSLSLLHAMDLVQHTKLVVSTVTIKQMTESLQQLCKERCIVLGLSQEPGLMELICRSLLVDVMEKAINASEVSAPFTAAMLNERIRRVHAQPMATTWEELVRRFTKLEAQAQQMGSARDGMLGALEACLDRQMGHWINEIAAELLKRLAPTLERVKQIRRDMHQRRFVQFSNCKGTMFFDKGMTEKVPKGSRPPGFLADVLGLDATEAYLLGLSRYFGDQKTYCTFQSTFFRECLPLGKEATKAMAQSIRYCLLKTGTLGDMVQRLATPEPHFDHIGSSQQLAKGRGVSQKCAFLALRDMACLLFTKATLRKLFAYMRSQEEVKDGDADFSLRDLLTLEWDEHAQSSTARVSPELRIDLLKTDDQSILQVYFVCCWRHYKADAISDDIVFRLLPLLLQATAARVNKIKDVIENRPPERSGRVFDPQCAQPWSAKEILTLIAPDRCQMSMMEEVYPELWKQQFDVLVNPKLHVNVEGQWKSWPVVHVPGAMMSSRVEKYDEGEALQWIKHITHVAQALKPIISASSSLEAKLNSPAVLLIDNQETWTWTREVDDTAMMDANQPGPPLAAFIRLEYPVQVMASNLTLRAVSARAPQSVDVVAEDGSTLGRADFPAAAEGANTTTAMCHWDHTASKSFICNLYGEGVLELEFVSLQIVHASQPTGNHVMPAAESSQSSTDSDGDAIDADGDLIAALRDSDKFLLRFSAVLRSAKVRAVIKHSFADDSGADLLFILSSASLFNQFIRHCDQARVFDERRSIVAHPADDFTPLGNVAVLLRMQRDAHGQPQQETLVKVMVATLPHGIAQSDHKKYFMRLGVRAGACKIICMLPASSIVDQLPLADVVVPERLLTSLKHSGGNVSNSASASTAAAASPSLSSSPDDDIDLDDETSFVPAETRPAYVWFNKVVLSAHRFQEAVQGYTADCMELRQKCDIALTPEGTASIVVPRMSPELKIHHERNISLLMVPAAEQARLLGSDVTPAELQQLTLRNIGGVLCEQDLPPHLVQHEQSGELLLLAPVWHARHHAQGPDPQGRFETSVAFQDHMRTQSWRLLTAIAQVAVEGEAALEQLDIAHTNADLLPLDPPLQSAVFEYTLQLPHGHLFHDSTLHVSLRAASEHCTVSFGYWPDETLSNNIRFHTIASQPNRLLAFTVTVSAGLSAWLVIRVARTMVCRYRIRICAPRTLATADEILAQDVEARQQHEDDDCVIVAPSYFARAAAAPAAVALIASRTQFSGSRSISQDQPQSARNSTKLRHVHVAVPSASASVAASAHRSSSSAAASASASKRSKSAVQPVVPSGVESPAAAPTAAASSQPLGGAAVAAPRLNDTVAKQHSKMHPFFLKKEASRSSGGGNVGAAAAESSSKKRTGAQALLAPAAHEIGATATAAIPQAQTATAQQPYAKRPTSESAVAARKERSSSSDLRHGRAHVPGAAAADSSAAASSSHLGEFDSEDFC